VRCSRDGENTSTRRLPPLLLEPYVNEGELRCTSGVRQRHSSRHRITAHRRRPERRERSRNARARQSVRGPTHRPYDPFNPPMGRQATEIEPTYAACCALRRGTRGRRIRLRRWTLHHSASPVTTARRPMLAIDLSHECLGNCAEKLEGLSRLALVWADIGPCTWRRTAFEWRPRPPPHSNLPLANTDWRAIALPPPRR
jgi:hypothetical protein